MDERNMNGDFNSINDNYNENDNNNEKPLFFEKRKNERSLSLVTQQSSQPTTTININLATISKQRLNDGNSQQTLATTESYIDQTQIQTQIQTSQDNDSIKAVNHNDDSMMTTAQPVPGLPNITIKQEN